MDSSKLSSSNKLSNHSARKYLVQRLSDCSVPPTQIMQITGHKNIQSINNYSKIDEVQHHEISHILSGQSTHMVPRHALETATTGNRPMSSVSTSQNKLTVSVSGGVNMLFAAPIYGGNITINFQSRSKIPSNCQCFRIQ